MPPRPLAALLALAACSADNDDTTNITSGVTELTAPSEATTPTTTASTGDASTSTADPTTGASTTTSAPTSSTSTTAPPETDTTDTTTDGPVVSDCADPPCFNIINNCSFPLWIHAANNANVILVPDDVMLAPGAVQQYHVPPEWPAGRVNAHYVDPSVDPAAHDKVEMTVTGGTMNYNITYVDYVSLPAEMVAVGPECQETPDFDPRVGCYVPRDELLNGCPDDLLAGERCLSAHFYCNVPANQGTPYCHALDDEIAACAAQHPDTCGVAMQLGATTNDVYGCASYFDSQPPDCGPVASPACHAEGNRWCAALNRGMLADPGSTDTANYYQTPPYNTYAKWVHATCPGIYAFAYDDYPANAGESGFRSCKADRLDVTFCPAG